MKEEGGSRSLISTTWAHPFWSEDRSRWIDASNLRPGEQLRTLDTGDTVHVITVDNYVGDKTMYDLTVADTHTYYVMVGNTAVLVHNCGTGGGVPKEANGQPATLTFRGDTRGPDEIFESGFKPWGDDMDLMGHASGANHATSGYVSTSVRREVAEGFGPNVYVIRAPGGVDVNQRLGSPSPFPSEAEIAFPRGVEPSCIVGCTLPKGTWVPNLRYGR